MNEYIYDGPVMEFDICIADRWKGYTKAVSEKKARSNLIFQYKMHNNKTASSKVSLPGKITLL